MVGHDLECIQNQRREPFGQRIPTFLNQATRIVQEHLALDDFAEKELPGLSTDGDEICTATGVIIPTQTNGPSMM
jgi:hypothetical protein